MPKRQPDPDAGLRRLRAAMTRRPGRPQLVVALLLAILGFAAVVQVRTYSDDSDLAGARRGDLVQLLDSLDAGEERLSNQLDDLNATKRRLESSTDRTQAARQSARQEADRLSVLSGTVPVTGPGIRITITDNDNAVGASTLLNAVEELRDAGAEAIALNGVVRVIAQSYFVDSDRGIRVDGRELTRPLTIDVIGDADTLREAVEFRGGLIDEVELVGGKVDVQEQNKIEITALSDPREPEYAQPAS